jgi:hypothetical protein
VEPLVAAPAMDQVGTTGAVDAGAMAVGAELVVAVAADDPLAVPQPEHEVDTTGHPHKPPPQGAGDLRVTTNPGAGIKPQQPSREHPWERGCRKRPDDLVVKLDVAADVCPAHQLVQHIPLFGARRRRRPTWCSRRGDG